MRGIRLVAALLGMLVGSGAEADEGPRVAFVEAADAGRLEIRIDGVPVATYVYRDPQIPRPSFRDLHAPGGPLLTRPHPPGPGDPDDHPTMHPGLWLAFGDLNGHDFWRHRGVVEHARFEGSPRGGAGRGTFAVLNHYRESAGGRVVAEEHARFTIHARPGRTLLLWDSEFRPVGSPLTFGDQEEMGLGVRVATPLAVKQGRGGRLVDAEGRAGEGLVRGTSSAWCSARGTIDGLEVALTLLVDPENFRPPWWHARDYGLIVANPFGRAALTGGEPSRVVVPLGRSLRLRFGVALESAGPGRAPDPASAYKEYLRLRDVP